MGETDASPHHANFTHSISVWEGAGGRSEAGKGTGLTRTLPASYWPPACPGPCPNCIFVWVLALEGGDSGVGGGEGAQAESRERPSSREDSSLQPLPQTSALWTLSPYTELPQVRAWGLPTAQAEGRLKARLKADQSCLGNNPGLRGPNLWGHGTGAAAAAPRLG